MTKPEMITPFDGQPEWFEETAKTAGLQFLLAFTDDQVITGWPEKKTLYTPTPINVIHLQRAHLFGKSGELRLIRNETGFEAVWLDDSGWDADDLQDENYPIWRDGQQGLDYSAPAQFDQLEVRHYIRYDDQGQAYFSHSRLVAFSRGKK